MAIDPQTTDTVTIPQLDPLVLALETYLVGANADGKMGNFTAQQLAELIAPYVSAIGSSPFVANTGSPLPNPIEKPTAITFVGIGDFDQTTGDNVVTTEELNVLFWSSNGTTGTWTLGIEIPINLGDYLRKDQITINDFYFDSSVSIFRNFYLNGTAFPTAESGAIYVEIPRTTGGFYYQGITQNTPPSGDAIYLTNYSWLTAAGVRDGPTIQTLGNTILPLNINTSVSTRVTLRINIFRLLQNAYFNFSNFEIIDFDGKVLVKYIGEVKEIDGYQISPSDSYQDQVNSNFDADRTEIAALKQSISTKGVSLNYPIIKVDSGHKRFDHGHIKRVPDGSLIAVHSYFYADAGDLMPSNLAVSKSIDNGRSWTLLGIKPFSVISGITDVDAESNPDVGVDNNGNLIVFFSIKRAALGNDRSLAFCTLSNNGTTWGSATLLTSWDKTAPGGGGGWKTRSGLIYMPAYRLISGTTSADAISVGRLWKSTDGGLTFTDVGVDIYDTNTTTAYTVSVFEPGIYETISGTLIYYYRTLQGYCRARKSTDGGLTWGASFNLFKAANSMSNVKRLSFLDNKLNFIYLAVCNPIEGAISSHVIDRRYMGLAVSIDGENFVTTDILIYNYNGTKIAFEPNIYEDLITTNIYIAWSADTGGIDLYTAIISRFDIIKTVNKYLAV